MKSIQINFAKDSIEDERRGKSDGIKSAVSEYHFALKFDNDPCAIGKKQHHLSKSCTVLTAREKISLQKGRLFET